MSKLKLSITPPEGVEPEIGRWLWAMEDLRRRLKQAVAQVTPEELDHRPPHSNSVGALLYHLAAIEADWLYSEILQAEFPNDVVALFPHDVRDEQGILTPVAGASLESYLERLDAVRSRFLAAVGALDLAEWRRPRELPNYDVTPEWVVYHLIRHEAHHMGQIADLLRVLRHA